MNDFFLILKHKDEKKKKLHRVYVKQYVKQKWHLMNNLNFL